MRGLSRYLLIKLRFMFMKQINIIINIYYYFATFIIVLTATVALGLTNGFGGGRGLGGFTDFTTSGIPGVPFDLESPTIYSVIQ